MTGITTALRRVSGWYNSLRTRKKVFLWIGAFFGGLIVFVAVFGETAEPDVAPVQAVTAPLTQTPEPATPPTTAPTATSTPAPTEKPTPTEGPPTPTVPPTLTPTPTSTPTPPPIREQVEDCLDPWDGNHNGFEDQIRPLLNDRGSMKTHETRFGVEDYSLNRVLIKMVYSAKNSFGGRVSVEAIGLLDYTTCEVEVLLTGLEGE